jgi:hypothetical protein
MTFDDSSNGSDSWKPDDGKCESDKGETELNSYDDCHLRNAGGGGGSGSQPPRAKEQTKD